MKSFRDRNPYAVGIISVLVIGAATGFAFAVGILNTLRVALAGIAAATLLGGAVGLAVLNTSLTSNTALHMSELTQNISVTNGGMQAMLAGMQERFAGSIDPAGAAMKAVQGMLNLQATTLAFGDAFAMLAVGCVFAAFVTLLSRPVKAATGGPPMDAH